MTDLVTTKPNMPTAARYKRLLAPMVDDSGKVTAQSIHKGTQLIPMNDCHAVIAEIAAALDPCTEAPALVFANLLIGQCTIKEVVDPKIYVMTLASKFAKFPRDMCARIVDELTDTLKFNPKGADVMECGNRMLREREAALYTARKHLDERKRRAEWAEGQSKLREDRKGRNDAVRALYEKMGVEWPGDDIASFAHCAAAGTKSED